MKRIAAIGLALTLGAAAVAPLSAGAGIRTGIAGVVRNTSCYGPCRTPPPPAPLFGGATVTIREAGSGELTARLHPKDGRFALHVERGDYVVRARVAGQCWQGSRRDVTVTRGELSHVRLTVYNACIV